MRALLLVMIVAATLPMAFVRPIIGLMLWIGFSYMNPHRIAFGFATSYPWVMIVAVVTLFSMAVNARHRQPMPMTPLTVLMLLFLGWTGIATLNSVLPQLAEEEWVEFFKILVMAFATMMLVTDRQRLHWVLWGIVASFGFWGFKGGLFTILSGGGYHVFGPVHSFFRDNNDFALVMCMTIPLIRYLQLQESRRWLRIGLWILMGLTVVSILGTYSRGGFLGLAAVACMLLLKSRRRFGLIVSAIAIGFALYSFMPAKYTHRIDSISNYQQDGSAQGRIESWRFATQVALANPLTGGGFDVWASDNMWDRYGPPAAEHRAIHSIFFQVLGEQGIVGFGFFVALLVASWRSLAGIRKKASQRSDLSWMADLASMMQVSLVGFVAAGTFLPMPYFDLFYQLVAIAALVQLFLSRALSESAKDDGHVSSPPRPAGAHGGADLPAAGLQSRRYGGSGTHELPWW